MSEMSLAEKDKYIEEHLMPLQADTLRYMVADHVSIIDHQAAEIEGLKRKVEEAGEGVEYWKEAQAYAENQYLECKQSEKGWCQDWAVAEAQHNEDVKTIAALKEANSRLEREGKVLAEAVLACHVGPYEVDDPRHPDYDTNNNKLPCDCPACQLSRNILGRK